MAGERVQGGFEIWEGLSDTDDGIKLGVNGEAFPRVHITPQGEILTGAGAADPVGLSGTYVPQPAVAATVGQVLSASGVGPLVTDWIDAAAGAAIARVWNIETDFGAVRYATLAAAQAGTDSTAAFKTALSTAADAGGGRIVVAPGFYKIGGALDTTQRGRAQIPLPSRTVTSTAVPFVSVELWCPQPAGVMAWVNGVATHGAVLVSTLAGSVYNTTNGIPSVLGGPTLETQGFTQFGGTSFVSEFTKMHFSMRGIAVAQPSNPTLTAFDFTLVSNLTVESCRAEQHGSPTNAQPTNPWAHGLIMPRNNNHVTNNVREFHCYGYFAGLAFAEHARATDIVVVECEVGLVPFSRSGHASALGQVTSENCHYDIAQVDPATGVRAGLLNQSPSYFAIENLDLEDLPTYTAGDWRDKRTGANIYDPFDNLQARISKSRFVAGTNGGYDVGPIKIVGGAGVVSHEVTTGATAAQTNTVNTTTADSTTTLPARTQSAPTGISPVYNVRSLAAVQLAGTWGISSNKAYLVANTPNTATYGAVAVWDWYHADGSMSCPITLSTTKAHVRLVARATDKDNYICAEILADGTGGRVRLFEVNAGVGTLLAQTGLLAPAVIGLGNTYTLGFDFYGRSLTAKLDGVTQATYTVGAGSQPRNVSPQHGIGVTLANDGGLSRFGNVSFTPRG